jgi:hypothetical protein
MRPTLEWMTYHVKNGRADNELKAAPKMKCNVMKKQEMLKFFDCSLQLIEQIAKYVPQYLYNYHFAHKASPSKPKLLIPSHHPDMLFSPNATNTPTKQIWYIKMNHLTTPLGNMKTEKERCRVISHFKETICVLYIVPPQT